tara:strand:+ start:159 stop:350 length:192 start_codon:yes stop_codon:yes gene_type:complete
MIDEDRTYENEVRFINDRLGIIEDRKNNKGNIPLVVESPNTKKMEKEKIDEMDTALSNMFISK